MVFIFGVVFMECVFECFGFYVKGVVVGNGVEVFCWNVECLCGFGVGGVCLF